MSVQNALENCKAILRRLIEEQGERGCIRITGYDSIAINSFIEQGIDSALKHYQQEAKRKKEKFRKRYQP